MSITFDDGREFNQLYRQLEQAMASCRCIKHTSEAYCDSLNDLHEAFNAFVDLLEARERKIETEEDLENTRSSL